MSILNIRFYAGLLTLALLGSGCKKFLAQQSQNLEYADNASKLEETLNGDGYMPHFISLPASSYQEQTKPMYFPWLNAMDDDITEFVKSPYYDDPRDPVFGFYTWQANPFVTKNYSINNDDSWAKTYVNINAVNIVEQKAQELTDDPQRLRRIRGEALFLRAHYYFYMVNVYAPVYNPKTAVTDPGVPLKTTDFVQDGFFTRSTVDSVYKQIVADLKTAETLLDSTTAPSIYHADVNAVNLLQSRVYLYMQQWADAATAADKVIARRPELYDLNGYTPHTSFFFPQSPEAIFTEGGNAVMYYMLEDRPTALTVSPDLLNLYDNTDLRRTSFFEVDAVGKYRYTKMYYSVDNKVLPTEILSDNYFMRNAEAYLNKAEAAAMQNDATGAAKALNTLRQARFRPVDYKPVTLSGAPLVNFVRDERRRELCFEGQRWFDLRRYAVNAQYPFSKNIVHTYSSVVYGGSPFLKASLTLEPGSPDYIIPLPSEAIVYNQGTLVQNPTRPDRTF